MGSQWFTAEATRCRWVRLCALCGLFCLCMAGTPAFAEEGNVDTTNIETTVENSSAAPEAADIRATDDVRANKGFKRRLPLERLLRDMLFGVAWDRTRLPFRASLYGNDQNTVMLKMTLSRRNFSGLTLQVRF